MENFTILQMMANYPNISVVIPNIGEKSLIEVINSLNSGLIKPQEIILVTPTSRIKNISDIKFDKNVRIIISEVSSQVEQRIIGFKNAKHDLVMQLDADIIFQKDTLYELYNCMSANKNGIAIGPYFQKSKSAKKNYLKIFLFYFFIFREKKKLVWDSWFFHDHKDNNYNNFKTRWLPGGCILFQKKDLIFENYYSYPGKAFDEDLLHSVLLRRKGIELIHCGKAHCHSLEDNYHHQEIKILFNYLKRVFIVKNRVRYLGEGSLLIFCIWFFYWATSEILRFFFKNHLR